MAVVCVHGPLRGLAGDRAEQEVSGATVHELLRALEDLHPSVVGWILDSAASSPAHKCVRER